MEYTYDELTSIAHSIRDMIDRSDKKEYSRKLLYALHKNMKVATNELEDIEKAIKPEPEKYKEYRKKLFEAVLANGGVRDGNLARMDVEGFDRTAFDAAKLKLDQEYSDVIKEGEETSAQNREYIKEHKSEVEWFKINIEWFPETVSNKHMPFEILDLIEHGSN